LEITPVLIVCIPCKLFAAANTGEGVNYWFN
jgi:hypothetical protein